jgi:methionyl-tRNA formyltransferase
MRFAITGVDHTLVIFDTLLAAGWEPVKVFTMPVDNHNAYHANLVNMAAARKVPVQLSRLEQSDLRALAEQQCEVLVVASYAWKIGDWTPYLPHAINFHPSLLPHARGPYPVIRAVLREEKTWGVTCHKVAPQFDTGDILAQRSFALDAQESHESINLKVQMAWRPLVNEVAHNFTALWDAAQPQGEGSYWPLLSEQERTIDFAGSVAEILRLVRACGLFECKAKVDGRPIFVRRAVGWVEAHQRLLGELVHVQHRTMVVAVRDGYIGLVEWSAIEPGGQRNVGR